MARVPQGLATWRNWDGNGNNLLLYTAYRDGSDAYIQGINPATAPRSSGWRTATSAGSPFPAAGR